MKPHQANSQERITFMMEESICPYIDIKNFELATMACQIDDKQVSCDWVNYKTCNKYIHHKDQLREEYVLLYGDYFEGNF